MSQIYLNQVTPCEEDLSPLVGCLLVDISDGAGEDGEEVATLVFYNPGNKKYIRLSISEYSELSLSDFEEA